jgi:hypothetical protein
MRPLLFAVILCVLILTACSGAGAPTATSVPPTAVPPTNPSIPEVNNSLATLAATAGVNLSQPGTLVIPINALSPNAPTDAPIAFNDLTFTQTGGITGLNLVIQIKGDGTFIRDGKTARVTQDDLRKIETLLDGIHFFSLQGIFNGPSAPVDAYQYSLTVNAAQGSRTISSQDGLTPPELNQIYDAIRNLRPTS